MVIIKRFHRLVIIIYFPIYLFSILSSLNVNVCTVCTNSEENYLYDTGITYRTNDFLLKNYHC